MRVSEPHAEPQFQMSLDGFTAWAMGSRREYEGLHAKDEDSRNRDILGQASFQLTHSTQRGVLDFPRASAGFQGSGFQCASVFLCFAFGFLQPDVHEMFGQVFSTALRCQLLFPFSLAHLISAEWTLPARIKPVYAPIKPAHVTDSLRECEQGVNLHRRCKNRPGRGTPWERHPFHDTHLDRNRFRAETGAC